jgi:pilus assembly protein CpaF
MLDKKISEFLKKCVQKKLNIMVTGGTSTGKTTLLNVLSNFIGKDERIITIEDTLELNLNLPHVISLESRTPNIEGKGEISIRRLVKNSLRMRPDRIIIGEIRGLEAIDVLQAMNTGHSGSMSTLHANSPQDLISRLETLLLMAGLNLTPETAKRIQASSLDLIIHLEKLENGRKVISKISEIISKGEKELEVRDIYKSWKGNFIHTGYEPGFLNKLER